MRKKFLAALMAAGMMTTGASGAWATAPDLKGLLDQMKEAAQVTPIQIQMDEAPVTSTIPWSSNQAKDYEVKDGVVVTLEEQEVLAEAEALHNSESNDGMKRAYAQLVQKYLLETQKDPGDVNALLRLAVAYKLNGEGGNYLAAVKKAVKMDAKSEKILNMLAEKWNQDGFQGFKVIALGNELQFDVPPQVINGRTLIPLRKVTEALGAKIDYNGEARMVTIELSNKRIQLVLDSADATVNGNSVKLDVPAMVVDGRTLVPLRFVSESLDKAVGFAMNGDARVISISDR